MIKFITTSTFSPFNFILNGKEVWGGSPFEQKFKRELNKLSLSVSKTKSYLRKLSLIGVRTMLVKLLDMFLNFKPYRNPSELNKFEFGG